MPFSAVLSIFVASVLSTAFTVSSQTTTVVVNSKSGPIKGTAVTERNETVYQFRKIPYAKPPLGALRFKKPVAYGTWNDTMDATEFGPSCMQTIDPLTIPDLPNTNISEDCLLLNIYVPRNISEKGNMTVMVWIHGGSFIFGQGMIYDGSFLALSGNVIVVTINYRLNIFGFLSTGDRAAMGNYGLWDQHMAIEWVRENIYAFGGNPYSITIFGESAGSLSIGLHTLYPGNKDLFQRAIMESGSGNSFVSYTNKSPKGAELFGQLLNCTGNDSNDLVDCLRNISSDMLLGVLTTAANLSFDKINPHIGLQLGPAIDGDFVKDDPKKLISNSSSESYEVFRSLDIMVGTMSGEGSLLLGALSPYQQIYNFNLSLGVPRSILCNHLAPTIATDFYMGNQNISAAICNKYTVKNTTDVAEQGRQIVNMFGDMMFVGPAVETLEIHSKGNTDTKSYQFHFTHLNHRAYGPPLPPWFKGASHGTELLYLYAIPKAYKRNVTFSSQDIQLSNYMLKYWTNFANTGDPNGHFLPMWPEFKVNSSYLDLDLNITAKSKVYADRMQFWLKTIPQIEKSIIPMNHTTPALPTSTKLSTMSTAGSPRMPTRTKRVKTSRKTTITTPTISPTTMTGSLMNMTTTAHTPAPSKASATPINVIFIFSVLFYKLF